MMSVHDENVRVNKMDGCDDECTCGKKIKEGCYESTCVNKMMKEGCDVMKCGCDEERTCMKRCYEERT